MGVCIEPLNCQSVRSAKRVVDLIRKHREIRDNVICYMAVNGFGDWGVFVLCDSEYQESVECLLNSNQDAYNFYRATFPGECIKF